MSRLGKILALGGLGLVAVLFMIGSWFVGSSNELVAMEAEVDGAWAQVENGLQRRYDLIPNLVSTVEGSMTQEREIFESIADARRTVASASTVEDVADANVNLTSELQTLVNVVHESYPDLASNENVQNLMTQLEGTENRIAVERQRYNETVTQYNVTIKQIPMNIIAGFTGHNERDLFEAADGAEVAPTVEFDFGG